MQQPSETYQVHLKGLLLLLLMIMMMGKAGGSTPRRSKTRRLNMLSLPPRLQGLGHGLKTARRGSRRTPLT